MIESEGQSACEDLLKYNNGCRSKYAYKLEQWLLRVQKYLVIRNENLLQAMIEGQLQLARYASYYWLDFKVERLYKRVIWNDNSHLVIIVDGQLQLLKACYNEVGY